MKISTASSICTLCDRENMYASRKVLYNSIWRIKSSFAFLVMYPLMSDLSVSKMEIHFFLRHATLKLFVCFWTAINLSDDRPHRRIIGKAFIRLYNMLYFTINNKHISSCSFIKLAVYWYRMYRFCYYSVYFISSFSASVKK